MSPTSFQKYVEVMNRQPLGKRVEHQGADVLLPHQRTGPINPLVTEESISQVPKGVSDVKFGCDTLRQAFIDTSGTSSKTLSPGHSREANISRNQALPLDHQFKSSKLLSVDYDLYQDQSYVLTHSAQSHESTQKTDTMTTPRGMKTGLAKSRWADSSYEYTPVSKTGRFVAIPIISSHNGQQGAVEMQVAPPSDQKANTATNGALSKKHTSLATNRPDTPLKKSNNYITTSNLNKPKRTQDDGWDESRYMGNQTQASGLQPLTVVTLTPATRESAKAEKNNITSINRDDELKLGKTKSNDTTLDPRRNWPTESGVLENVDRDQTSQLQKESSDDIISGSTEENVVPQYMTDFIKTWAQSVPHVRAEFIYQNIDHHEDYDVDTYRGVLMDPVEYPKTRCSELTSRAQLDQTSYSSMKQFAAEIARRKRKTERQDRVTSMPVEIEAAPLREELPNPNKVQIPCHLRPATELDIEAITDIYNHEIAEGYNVMDTNPLEEEDFYKMYNRCVTEKIPFIVAVKGWHGEIEEPHQTVVGFSLVTAVSLGITGSYETLSSPGGKLLVIVKPEYRRKKIGTALIDILMTNCTGWYISKSGYQFVNFTHDWISAEFGTNPRKWWYLDMEVMIRSGEKEEITRKGEEFQWIWNFLESKFDLLLKHYDEKCFYEPRHMTWLDKLTFRRPCR
ncbi:hypothetical protein GGS24DRAFT_511008 [Hypoxylon argillaceum]|nr:hypothetical protein GGS24DRAFT_511008 [Hypoxylon argillaceum]